MALIPAVVVGLIVAAASTPAFAWLATRLGVVDRPGPLKVQSHPVPYFGGLAVLAGIAVPVLSTRPSIALPLCAATILGLIDDASGLGSRTRLLCEVGLGVLVAVTIGLAWPWVAVGMAVTVVLVNAVNLLDGLDGLASGTALVSAAGLAVVLEGDARVLGAALAAALAGFLVWNRPPARIYLGDAGSYLIGTALAVLVCASLDDTYGSIPAAAAAALLVGVPVADMAIAVIRRRRARRPLFSGDRAHVYDQLVDRGLSPERATLACIVAQAVLGAVAIVTSTLTDGAAIALSLATIVVVAVLAIPTFTSPSDSARWGQ